MPLNSAANFDRLARPYRALEVLAFGRDLERARFCLLDRLAAARSILIIGEGDGRCLERLTTLAPQARIDCFDASEKMLGLARSRLAASNPAALERVRFQQADARANALLPAAYDAAVTLFFLDCFTAQEAAEVVGRIAPSLAPGALWLFADFSMPAAGWRRFRARLWLGLLYFFFRLETGLSARKLPPAEELIRAAGLEPVDERPRQQGLLRTVLFRKP